MPSKSKSSKRHPSSDPPEPKSHPNPTSSNPILDPAAPTPSKNPNPRSSKPTKPSSSTPALPQSPSKPSDTMMPDDSSAASPSRKSDRKRKARDLSDDELPAAKSPQPGQRRLADDNAVALLRAAIDFRSRTGSIPLASHMSAFYDSAKASLLTPLTKDQVYNKLRHLRQKFQKAGPPGSGPNDGLVHELCAELWGGEDNKDVSKDRKKANKGTLVVAVENGVAADEEEEEPEEEVDGEERGGGGPDSLPYVSSAAAEHWKANGLCGVSWEVGLKRMDSSKARSLEEKWRRRWATR
uniref:Smoothelin-like n=1 Tax=Elaeis guineensis var. tenera TaxID=51953 RepID=A0A6I9RHP2_ELAGV|nr:smoothelin-like [Elaeis guineensis]